MAILDKLTQKSTGMYRMSDFRSPPIVALECESTSAVRMDTLDRNEEFQLQATVAVRFWANQAQYRDARLTAERVLLNRLYGDTLALVYEARKAVYDGDANGAMAALLAIQKGLTGEES